MAKNDIYGGNPHGTVKLGISQPFVFLVARMVAVWPGFFAAGTVVLPEFLHREVEILRRGKKKCNRRHAEIG